MFAEIRNSVPFRVKTFGLVDTAVRQCLVDSMPLADCDSKRETRLAEVSVCLPTCDPVQYAKLVGPSGNLGFNDVIGLIVDLCDAGIAVECYTPARPGVDVEKTGMLALSLGAIRFRSLPYFE